MLKEAQAAGETEKVIARLRERIPLVAEHADTEDIGTEDEKLLGPSRDSSLRLLCVSASLLLCAPPSVCSSRPLRPPPGRIIAEVHGQDFYIIDKFPMAIRAFYTMADPNDGRFSNS